MCKRRDPWILRRGEKKNCLELPKTNHTFSDSDVTLRIQSFAVAAAMMGALGIVPLKKEDADKKPAAKEDGADGAI